MRRLICFGDSITAGWDGTRDTPRLTERLEKCLGWEIVNAGLSGDNTSGALDRIDNDVLKRQYDWVTVLFGANDSSFHKGIPLDQFRSQLTKIVRMIIPEKCILITPSPVVDEKQKRKRTNTRIARYARTVCETAETCHTQLIDLHAEMLALSNYSTLLLDDGLHFSDAGYDFLARLIADKLGKTKNK